VSAGGAGPDDAGPDDAGPGQAGPDQAGDDRRWLGAAVELARRCPPSTTAFAVGAIVVGADGRALASGYSRAGDPLDHAEEYALRMLPVGLDLAEATIYSSLEPCSARASRPRTCADLIIGAGIGRVVFAWREPSLFVDCEGAEILAAAGIEVVELPEFAAAARAVNRRLLPPVAESDDQLG
jgi:pyrimidine deaminase RibD-like protein